jgi:TetR/AcrR family transcriptional repressor of nem operon
MIIMRYPQGHKQAVRQRIVTSAAKTLRERGLDGVSIPALMKSAGLTHGGFYAHFESRDDLVAAAIEAAGAQTAEGAFSDAHSLDEALGLYLSGAHLEHPELGCPVAALGADGARQTPAVRRAFARAAKGLLELVERKLHPRRRAREISDEALRLTATMVGAVVLGRLVQDRALAERILSVARRTSPS